MKKFLCAILFLTMVISLSACGGKGVSTLVKHYGQEKVDAETSRMDIMSCLWQQNP